MNKRPAILSTLGAFAALTLYGCPPARVDPNIPLPNDPSEPDAGLFPPDAGRSPFSPEFGASIVRRPTAPPAISGGTMAVSSGDIVVVADPDRDEVSVVDASSTPRILGQIHLAEHSEPGRVAIGASGTAYVALRGTGKLLTIDTTDPRVVEERDVCPAPRGIAVDSDRVLVACVDGDVMSLPLAGGAPSVFYHDVVGDLRDIVLRDHSLYLTRFRTANVVVLDAADAHVLREFGPVQVTEMSGRFAGSLFQPSVAWRAVAAPNGIAMVHQRALLSAPNNAAIPTSSGGYGEVPLDEHSCGGSIVNTAVSVLSAAADTPTSTGEIPLAVLPVDMALGADGSIVLVAAGNALAPRATRVMRIHAQLGGMRGDCEFVESIPMVGQPTSVVILSDGRAVVQSREPATLTIERGQTLELDGSTRFDTGHAVFHANSGGGIACAGCHPEGGDDARVWVFDREGMRRTQNLRGGLLGTEPFHWGGDQANFDHLANDVFVGRMSGAPLTTAQVTAMAGWIDRIPTLPRPVAADLTAVERGQALFASSETGCTSCHSGAKLTNNVTVSVGTGGALQVPTLVGLRFRAPFMHTGCAATLRDRFTHPECGGGDQHGHTSQLSSAQIDDLVAYLQTL